MIHHKISISIAIAALAGALGCGGPGQGTSSRSPDERRQDEEQPGNEGGSEAPDTAGEDTGETPPAEDGVAVENGVAIPVDDEGPLSLPCSTELAKDCGGGKLVDGCLLEDKAGNSLTRYHICIPDGTRAGPPCSQEIARQCGEGLVDACLVKPPAAATHICVAPLTRS